MKKSKSKFALIFLLFFVSSFAAYSSYNAPEKEIKIPISASQKAIEFTEFARSQIGIVTKYDLSYFAFGEVPEDSGVCTDVIWRALLNVNYDIKSKVDEDIKNHSKDYPQSPAPDSNVDYRRVRTLKIFLDKYATKLTTKVTPNNTENLAEWQPGDIVTFEQLKTSGLQHIAIISDLRRPDGVPYLIHNHGQGTLENDFLLTWPAQISGHYRLL